MYPPPLLFTKNELHMNTTILTTLSRFSLVLLFPVVRGHRLCVTLIQFSHALAKLDSSECEIASELLPGMQHGVQLASMPLAEAMEVLAASHAKMQVEMACHVVMVHAVLTLRESRVCAATGEKERVRVKTRGCITIFSAPSF